MQSDYVHSQDTNRAVGFLAERLTNSRNERQYNLLPYQYSHLPDADIRYHAMRYSEIDFDDYFVLDRWECQYSVYLYLYEKSTRKNLFKDKQYLESGYDASANLLLYLDTDDKTNPNGNLTLLNLNNLTTVEIDVRHFIPTEDVLPNYYWSDFSVSKISDQSVRVTYDGEGQKSIVSVISLVMSCPCH